MGLRVYGLRFRTEKFGAHFLRVPKTRMLSSWGLSFGRSVEGPSGTWSVEDHTLGRKDLRHMARSHILQPPILVIIDSG